MSKGNSARQSGISGEFAQLSTKSRVQKLDAKMREVGAQLPEGNMPMASWG
jgi:hypothetical protein